ncbi:MULTISPECIES: M949_RS01915 family surface polysaccharide biosynthesis protein [Tenebrionibacter/Tenebrionicola group]|jgi:hypothetical protein|uniref:Uncharacterized protein n=2 Tax=Tenebrionibacter/Tenebrionicola group TaxID=2969848 RepID=A0A8K0V240_9ENTR|nr:MULTISPECIES: hypothetical protein [Tenebrionibacter/Tenebrionicola group]MBK4715583.1 hypothetical protein [Tenebrionibacter intestinalis]MBV4411386.1 hypothetical protein [Tenebrionicola larvae]MBV5095826.1 hypothetical protein [Tenebrionicola larvae]
MDIVKHRWATILCAALFYPQLLWAGEYKAVWVDAEGKHEVVIATSRQQNSLNMTGSELLNGKARWRLQDKIDSCPAQSEVKVFPGAFDVADVFGDKNNVLLFSYRLSCLGELEPGVIKYLAFYKGKRYELKGLETLRIADYAYGGEKSPQASRALRQNKKLYDYMMSKWKNASTTVIR